MRKLFAGPRCRGASAAIGTVAVPLQGKDAFPVAGHRCWRKCVQLESSRLGLPTAGKLPAQAKNMPGLKTCHDCESLKDVSVAASWEGPCKLPDIPIIHDCCLSGNSRSMVKKPSPQQRATPCQRAIARSIPHRQRAPSRQQATAARSPPALQARLSLKLPAPALLLVAVPWPVPNRSPQKLFEWAQADQCKYTQRRPVPTF